MVRTALLLASASKQQRREITTVFTALMVPRTVGGTGSRPGIRTTPVPGASPTIVSLARGSQMSSLRSARPTAPGSPGRSSTPKAAFRR